MNPKSAVLYISLILIFAIVIFLPIEFESTIKSTGRLYPVREWTLLRGANGEIIASLYDYKNGALKSYSITQIIRGDFAKFNLNTIKDIVKSGDTIGIFHSSEIEYQIERLKGLLDVELATLEFYLSGEKTPIIQEALKRYEQAKEQAEAQRKIFERAKILYEKNLISPQEFEIAQTMLKVYETNVEIAKAQLENVSTGAKEEQIKMIRANIKMIQREIEMLEKRLKNFVITSPISGVVNRTFSQDTIITIADTSELVAIFPINSTDISKIKPGQKAQIAEDKTLNGEVEKISGNIKFINGRQVIFCTAVFKSGKTFLKSGAIVTCSVSLGKVKLLEMITNFFKSVFENAKVRV